jgi:uncharacterized protein YndB with AHSA1/START domain
MTPDRIQKRVFLRAPLERVWHAIADSRQFGTWFGVAFDGPFVAGSRLAGKIVPTQLDAEIAQLQKPHEGKAFEFLVDAIDVRRSISFRWHPFAIEPGVDYTREPTTLILFELDEAEGGTQLTITESGFSTIPLSRRAKAFAANDGGWTKQTELISKYLAAEAAASISGSRTGMGLHARSNDS